MFEMIHFLPTYSAPLITKEGVYYLSDTGCSTTNPTIVTELVIRVFRKDEITCSQLNQDLIFEFSVVIH